MPLIEINPDLKMIARVGIGLDGVPLHECRKRGIRVSWTPDAVTRAVAELTVGQMLSSSRFVRMLDAGIRKQQWSRPAGRGIRESIIGLIGFGRIGSSVARFLGSFSPEQILVRDIFDKTSEIHPLQQEGLNIRSAGLEEILKSSHIISLHVPLWKETRHMIGVHELEMMGQDAMLINTARGGIVDETALRDALEKGLIKTGGTIVEGTAGNTGIGLALVGNSFGMKTVIVIPETQTEEKKATIRACGAELIEVPAVPYKDPNNYVKYSLSLIHI